MTYTYSELAALMSSITATTSEAIVEQAYAIVAGREADASGKAYWVARLEDDLTPETLIAAMIRGAEAYKENNPGEESYDIDTIAIKEQTAIELGDAGVSADDIASALMGVTDIASANAAIAAATGTGETGEDGETSFAGIIAQATGGVVSGTDGADTIYMSAAQDFVFAGEGNDMIVARGNGTLDNADIIDGGAGTDTIEVMLDQEESAESPLVTNVEILKVQVQDNMTDETGDNDVDENGAINDNADIDAGDMRSVEQYWSEDSRADLTIEDISRNSHITTIGMRETDPDVDYAAYFDPENITAPGATESGATLLVKMANVLQVAEGGNPIENFTQFSFSVDTTNVIVDVSEAEDYDDVVDAIEAAAAEAGLDVTVEKQAATEAYFSIDISGSVDYEAGDLAGTYNPILITNNGAGTLVKGSFATAEDATDAAYTNSMSTGDAATTPALTQVDVILDRVGKNSQGGELVIGSDSTGESGSAGIQQFNIDVDRDSWLEEISSTNDTLEVVNVENIEENSDGNGSLKVDLIQNIRVFDGSTMSGDTDVTIDLDGTVTTKYLNLQDDASNPAADNSENNWLDVIDREFSYDFGSGDDSLDLTIASDNLAQAGSTTREDFVMEVRAGDGDDSITTQIGNGFAIDTTNWYINSTINANLEIDAGSGDDTVHTNGAGNFTIDAGQGDDTVYADNSGAKATYVVGAVAGSTDITDLESDNAGAFFLVDGTLTVAFDDQFITDDAFAIRDHANDGDGATAGTGYEVTVDIPTGANYTVTQLHINQAIKEAINGDDVMSKFLVANDGPANTLIITSLVDNTDVDSLEIVISTPDYTDATVYTANKQTDIAEAYQTFTQDSTQDWAAAIAESEGNADANDTTAGEYGLGGAAISTAIEGIGVDGAVVGTTSATLEITFADGGAGATAGDTFTVTVDGTDYTYTSGAEDEVAVANGLQAVLAANGILAYNDGAGVLTVVSAETMVYSEVTAGAVAGTDVAGVTIDLDGTASLVSSDNVIEGNVGDDVLVLGSSLTSNDTVVFSGNFGTDVVVNFDDANAFGTASGDRIDFTAYLTDTEDASANTNDRSEVRVVTTVDLTGVGATDITDGNQVFIINDFEGDFGTDGNMNTSDDESWANLSETDLFNALETTDDNTDNYGNIDDATLDVANANAILVDDTAIKSIVMVENDLNDGEYKVFEVTSSDVAGDITDVNYVGTIDFGESITAAVDANFA